MTEGFGSVFQHVSFSPMISYEFRSTPVESLLAATENKKKFITTTCIFSQSRKSRAAPNHREIGAWHF